MEGVTQYSFKVGTFQYSLHLELVPEARKCSEYTDSALLSAALLMYNASDVLAIEALAARPISEL